MYRHGILKSTLHSGHHNACTGRPSLHRLNVRLNKLIQPQNWKKIEDAIEVTRDAKWNEEPAVGSRHTFLQPNPAKMWPGRCLDEG